MTGETIPQTQKLDNPFPTRELAEVMIHKNGFDTLIAVLERGLEIAPKKTIIFSGIGRSTIRGQLRDHAQAVIDEPLYRSLNLLRYYAHSGADKKNQLYVDLNPEELSERRFVPFDPRVHTQSNYALYDAGVLRARRHVERKMRQEKEELHDLPAALESHFLGRTEDLRKEKISTRCSNGAMTFQDNTGTNAQVHAAFLQGFAKQIARGFTPIL